MEHLVKVVLGDWSGDGHSITDSEVIQTNLTSNEIVKAYYEGSKIVGFNLSDDACCDYQDSLLRGDQVKKLRDAGINLDYDDSHEDPIEDEEDGVSLLAEEFLELYFEICKLHRPDLQYKIVKLSQINIGGYGLYSE